MHQPVTTIDRSRAAPPSISLRVGDRWIRVPAWWAGSHFRHGETVRSDHELAVRQAAVFAWAATRRLERISRMKDTPAALKTDAAHWQAEADAYLSRRRMEQRSRFTMRLTRALLLIGSAGVFATAIILILWSIFA